MSIAVVLGADDNGRARELAAAIRAQCVGPGDSVRTDLSLVSEEGVLKLRDHRAGNLRPLWADLQRRSGGSRKQLLGRAVGRKTRTVADATAGWGEDTRRLCDMGYTVTAIERHPVMAELLHDAARRANRDPLPGIVGANAIEYLAAHPGRWDCVYLDPMFPPKRRRSALTRRPLRLLRELVGDDLDGARLFDAATSAAARRVVVKRPDHGRPVFGKPTETVQGKLVRYDVYLVR